MTTAIAAFLQFYSNDVIHGSWQNFFVNKTVGGHVYVGFETSDVLLTELPTKAA